MPLDIKKDSKLKSGVNLVAIQLGLYLLPLVTTPYAVKTTGIANYGKYAFFQAVMGLLSVIASYGFMQTGVRNISTCPDIESVSREYSNIMLSKVVTLAAAGAAGLSLLVFRQFQEEMVLYLWSFLSLLVICLDTAFVYQGIEKLKDYVMVSLVGNAAVLAFLVLIVRREEDYVYLPVAYMMPRALCALLAVLLLRIRFGISPFYADIRQTSKLLRENFNFFISNIFIILYTRATSVLLGLMASSSYVGYYAIADQLAFAYSNIMGKVSAVYQPQAIQAFQNGVAEGEAITRECVQVVCILAVAGILFTQFFGSEILRLLFGGQGDGAQGALRLLSVNFLTIHLSSIFGMQILLSLRKDREILIPSIYAAFFNMAFGAVLIWYFKTTGAAASTVLVEIGVAIYFWRKVKRYGIDVIDRGMVKKFGAFSLSLAAALALIRALYANSGLNAFVKFPLALLVYGLSIVALLAAFRLIDFRNRTVVAWSAHE